MVWELPCQERVYDLLGSTFHDRLGCIFGDLIHTMLWESSLAGARVDGMLLPPPYMMDWVVSLVVCYKVTDWMTGFSGSFPWQVE